MRTILIAFALILTVGQAMASSEGPELMEAHPDVDNMASLQNGAKLFMNYCSGCHSLKYLRYKRLSDDLNIPEKVVEKQLIFSKDHKIGDNMTNAMPADLAQKWFGKAPPDLTLTARVRGADWIYTYLNTFYRDDSRIFGVNNLVLPNASMPHVLWRLQGVPEPVMKEVHSGGGKPKVEVADVKVPEKGGVMSEEQYHEATRDITNFLVYASEPVKSERRHLGIYVLLFLVALTFILYLLKKEFWKDVH